MHARYASPITLTRGALTLALILCAVASAPAQDGERTPIQVVPPPLPPPGEELPLDVDMDHKLFLLDKRINTDGRDPFEVAAELSLRLEPQGMILVTVVNELGDVGLSSTVIQGVAGEEGSRWRGRVDARIPAGRLLELENQLPPGFYLTRPNRGFVQDEGPARINSADYLAGGADGSGVRIGIIDTEFGGVPTSASLGFAPTGRTDRDYTGTGMFTGGRHGRGCLETAFDHAPGATYFLYKVDTDNDLANAVEDAIADGVDVLSHSLAWFNTGWDDDSGTICDAVQDASDAGILFFTAAGNYAQTHWAGAFRDTDGNDFHQWSGSDEGNRVLVPSGDTIAVHLQWDTSGGAHRYHLYLYNDAGTNVLAQSTRSGERPESLEWTNGGSSDRWVNVVIEHRNGGGTDLQVFCESDALEYWVEEGSIASPANSTADNLMVVGAVDQSVFGDPSPSTTDYSSQGPTHGGRTRPHLAGPTNTTVSYGDRSFGGTSCATPNVAGAAATFWSASPHLQASGVKHLLLRQAGIYKDWGSSGTDSEFGHGGAWLYAHHADTEWVDQSAGNTLGVRTLPYYYLADARGAATAGGRIVLIGGSYSPQTLSERLLYEAIGSTATIGL